MHVTTMVVYISIKFYFYILIYFLLIGRYINNSNIPPISTWISNTQYDIMCIYIYNSDSKLTLEYYTCDFSKEICI